MTKAGDVPAMKTALKPPTSCRDCSSGDSLSCSCDRGSVELLGTYGLGILRNRRAVSLLPSTCD